MAASNYYSHDWNAVFVFADHATQSILLWPVALLLISAFYLYRSLYSKSPNTAQHVSLLTKRKMGPPPKEDISIISNGYALEHEIAIPFDVGDVRVTKLLVHPIKSCRGTSVTESRYNPQGLENDRKWCIVDAETHAVLTAREVPKMVLISPRLVPDSSSPHGGELVVTFPEDSGCETFLVPLDPAPDVLRSWKVLQDCTLFGQILDGYICEPVSRASPSPTAVLSKYFARPVHLVMKGPEPRACPATLGVPDLKATAVFQDGYPFLVVSEESLEQVRRLVSLAAHKSQDDDGRIGGLDQRRWVDGDVEMERFRPNIVLKGSGLPFAEDTWREIVIAPELESNPKSASGTKTFTLVSKCARCLLPNVNPATGTRDAAVPYKVLMKFRTGKDPARQSKPCFGCNAVVGGKAIIRVGDWITVKEWAGVGGV